MTPQGPDNELLAQAVISTLVESPDVRAILEQTLH